MATMNAVNNLSFSVAILTDIHIGVTCLTAGLISLKGNAHILYKYMTLLAIHLGNYLIFPPDDLARILLKVKHAMRAYPYLELPDDQDKTFWHITPLSTLLSLSMYMQPYPLSMKVGYAWWHKVTYAW